MAVHNTRVNYNIIYFSKNNVKKIIAFKTDKSERLNLFSIRFNHSKFNNIEIPLNNYQLLQ